MDASIHRTELPVQLYRLYGLVLASNYRFKNLLPGDFGAPDISFSCTPTSPLSTEWNITQPAYVSESQTGDGEKMFSLYRMNGFDIARFGRYVDFYVWPERIIAHMPDISYDYMVEIHLFGEILSIWMEMHRIPMIHASAVSTKFGAVGFISNSHGGKSALAASLVQQGNQLLTDDILPIEIRSGVFFGRPGYPQMRMWPDEAEYFLGSYEDLEVIHPKFSKRRIPIGRNGFGTFCSENRQLKALYFPERHHGDTGVKIEPLTPKDALIELIRYSFSARIVEALGLAAQRMKLLAEMAVQVPMRRLTYPSGFPRLPVVREVLEDDIASL